MFEMQNISIKRGKKKKRQTFNNIKYLQVKEGMALKNLCLTSNVFVMDIALHSVIKRIIICPLF